MIRTLVATTAGLAMMTGVALSQATAPQAETAPPMTVESKELFKPMTGTTIDANAPIFLKATEGQILASGFVGTAVYNGDGDNAETIGKLNDIIIGPDGTVQAAVVGVGGFLGVGEKDVAVAPTQLKLSKRSDGNTWLVMNTTKDQLNSAPAFERSDNFTDGVADPAKADKNTTGSTTTDTPAK
jgi:hypothetical protein